MQFQVIHAICGIVYTPLLLYGFHFRKFHNIIDVRSRRILGLGCLETGIKVIYKLLEAICTLFRLWVHIIRADCKRGFRYVNLTLSRPGVCPTRKSRRIMGPFANLRARLLQRFASAIDSIGEYVHNLVPPNSWLRLRGQVSLTKWYPGLWMDALRTIYRHSATGKGME